MIAAEQTRGALLDETQGRRNVGKMKAGETKAEERGAASRKLLREAAPRFERTEMFLRGEARRRPDRLLASPRGLQNKKSRKRMVAAFDRRGRPARSAAATSPQRSLCAHYCAPIVRSALLFAYRSKRVTVRFERDRFAKDPSERTLFCPICARSKNSVRFPKGRIWRRARARPRR